MNEALDRLARHPATAAFVSRKLAQFWLADEPPPARPKGTVRTAIDRSFSRSSSVVGSLGYLCGLQPSAVTSGGVASSHEPAGTFLGGQLRVAF